MIAQVRLSFNSSFVNKSSNGFNSINNRMYQSEFSAKVFYSIFEMVLMAVAISVLIGVAVYV